MNTEDCGKFDDIVECPYYLGHEDKCLVLQNRCNCLVELLEKFSNEAMDLEVGVFFEKYYKRLYSLYRDFKNDYPVPNLSVDFMDFEELARRSKMTRP